MSVHRQWIRVFLAILSQQMRNNASYLFRAPCFRESWSVMACHWCIWIGSIWLATLPFLLNKFLIVICWLEDFSDILTNWSPASKRMNWMDAWALRGKDVCKGERPWGDTVCGPWVSNCETVSNLAWHAVHSGFAFGCGENIIITNNTLHLPWQLQYEINLLCSLGQINYEALGIVLELSRICYNSI